ncbi:MAG TPA: ABC transporter substrate-binding protein [Vicinamibacterales bacterium]|jgi:NitT/TauT family transport system substrate-binding protein
MRRVIVIVLACAVSGCHGAAPPAPEAHVRLAIHRDPIAFLPVRAAAALGYFRDEHLDVDITALTAGPKAVEALVGGSVDVAAASFSDAVLLSARRSGIVAFLLMSTRPLAAVAVAPGLDASIHAIRDLEGRTIGVSAPGSASHQILNFLLASNGLAPGDVSVAAVGMSATSLAALEHRKVDAAVLLASSIDAYEERHGAQLFIADTRSVEGARQVFGSDTLPSMSFVAHADWLRANAETARRLARALHKGNRWVREQSPERVRDLIPADAHLSSATVEIRAIQEMQDVLSADGQVPPVSWGPIVAFVAAFDPTFRAADVDLKATYTGEFAPSK